MTSPRSANIKIVLLIIAIAIMLGTLFYSQHIVNELLKREREVANLYARSLEFIANSRSDQGDYSFIFEQMVQQIDFPMVLTDAENQPSFPYRSSSRNLELDSTLTDEQLHARLVAIVHQLDAENPPIRVAAKGAGILNYVHYGESKLIKNLRRLPYIEFIVAGLFVFIGYLGFSHIKRSEQSNIWVGMAKETAHQLGTPLSSIMAWIDVMKTQAENDPQQLQTIDDMEHDLQRLQKVTERFSKIGSKPSIKEENINGIIDSAIQYFQRRLPSLQQARSKRVEFSVNPENGTTDEPVTARINRELFEWVIENLVKNAVHAMEGNGGVVTFNLSTTGNDVIIDVKDTGKGIEQRSRKDIFRPGYSTKERGWGLGLSLSRRIIEDYHKGKLFIKDSKIGKGTTFRIKLKK